MAVKPEKIKERLKVLFPSVNLSNQRIDAIAARLALKPADNAEDAAVDVVINDLNDIMSYDSIAKEDDRVRGLEAKIKINDETKIQAQKDIDDAKAIADQKIIDDAAKEMPEWAKGLVSGLEKITGEIETMKTGQTAESKMSNARTAFGASEILKAAKPEIQESWLKRIDINSETSVEDQIKGLETEYATLVQASADSTKHSGPPSASFSSSKPTDTEIDDVVAAI